MKRFRVKLADGTLKANFVPTETLLKIESRNFIVTFIFCKISNPQKRQKVTVHICI